MATTRLLVALFAWTLVAPGAALAQPGVEAEDGPRRYADQGTSEVSLLLGVSSEGVAFGGGFRHFVVTGVAPGVEGAVYRADGITQGFTFGSLRVVPLRFDSFALVVTGRAGRVFLSDHSDGWAFGGDAGVLMFFSQHVGLELGYEVLKLAPDSFCADLSDCVLQRPVLGVRVSF
jgi:hypothetical protein